MKATEFEYRHQTLVHQLIVGAAALTYVFGREDIVWRFVSDAAAPHTLERYAFVVATLFIAAGAAICTRARAVARPNRTRYLGDLFYAIGLASLVPVAGFVILVGGDALRIYRLIEREKNPAHRSQPQSEATPPPAHPFARESNPAWGTAFRKEAVKWGLLVSMIVFSITLVDRQADILVAASFLVGLLLNPPAFRRSPSGVQSR